MDRLIQRAYPSHGVNRFTGKSPLDQPEASKLRYSLMNMQGQRSHLLRFTVVRHRSKLTIRTLSSTQITSNIFLPPEFQFLPSQPSALASINITLHTSFTLQQSSDCIHHDKALRSNTSSFSSGLAFYANLMLQLQSLLARNLKTLSSIYNLTVYPSKLDSHFI